MTTAITGVVHEAIALDTFEDSIREGYRRFVSTAYESLETAATIGRDLTAVKKELKHGEFLPWVEEHCDFTRQWASAFMRSATTFPLLQNGKATSHLPAPAVETTATLATFDDDTQKQIIDEWQDSEGDMLPIIRRHRRDQKIERRVSDAGDLAEPDGEITKRVGIILADPPWQYRFSPTTSREIENQYPTESAESLAAMKSSIDTWTMDDCILYMWATSPKLMEAGDLIAAWGFDYRTCAVWDKQIDGMGVWFRQRHELLLVGVRGQFEPPADRDRVSSVIEAKRTKHSEKPAIVHELIEKWYPGVPKLEMFARSKREGWFAWGNEVEALHNTKGRMSDGGGNCGT